MNYDGKIKELLEIKSIWGDKFKEIHDDAINEVKAFIKDKEKMDESKLQRMLYILEDKKEPQSELINVIIGGVAMVLSVAALTESVVDGAGMKTSTVLIFMVLMLGFMLYAGFVRAPRSHCRNNKIECIEIAINELLKEGLTVEK